ncbi:MAG: hypothetical protein CL930_11555 [Deltaproteobacteria bacterium]|nr:hypothetical protein [Deltaproteobacteria bacterium]
MSETQEAKSLAEWIDGEPGKAIPTIIDEEVVECIIALRPEFALPARIQVEDILASVTEGPLVDPAIARALQTWIEAEPGTPPPPILPIGIVEATYALRPELAPAPRVSIDDILQSVTTGPLADEALHPGTDEVISLETERSKRKWWAGPSAGALAVAAIALIFVKPIAHKTSSPDQASNIPSESAIASDASEGQQVLVEATFEAREKTKESSPIRPQVTADSIPSPSPKRARSAPPRARSFAINESIQSARVANEDAPPQAAPEPEALVPVQPTPRAAMIDDSMLMADMDGTPDAAGSLSAPPAVSVSAVRSKQRRKRPSRTEAQAGGMPALEAKKDTTTMDFESVEVEEEALEMEGEAPGETRSRMSKNDAIVKGAIQRAEALLEQGKPTQALASLERALLLEVNNPFLKAKVWRTKAKAFDALGHATEAKQARKTAAKLDPAR